MKSLQSCLALFGLIAFCAPSTTKPYYVTTVETRRYVEPEFSPEAWILTLITIPFVYWLSEKLAPSYVESQEDIEAYSLTVKIKQRSKTVIESTFTSSDYDDVIEKALDFAQKKQGENQSLVFWPSITILQKRNPYTLDTIRKSALPSRPDKQDAYWKQIKHELTRTFIVPEKVSAPQQTHVTHHHVREVQYVTIVPEPRYSTFWIF